MRSWNELMDLCYEDPVLLTDSELRRVYDSYLGEVSESVLPTFWESVRETMDERGLDV